MKLIRHIHKVMKANEAPEKLWWLEGAVWHTNPNSISYVEYTRTDAFIEKAVKWIDNFLSESTLIDYKVTPIVRNAVIENFKNYIKGE